MNHLTERELIDYRFGLGRPELARRVEGHLEECAECRGKLEELKRRFAALDLLGAEEEVSEGLVAQVLAEARRAVGRGRHLPGLSVWVSAAAAVLVIGAALVVSHTGMKKTQEAAREGVAEDSRHAVERPSEEMGVGDDGLTVVKADDKGETPSVRDKGGMPSPRSFAWETGEKADGVEVLSSKAELARDADEGRGTALVTNAAAPLAEMGAAMAGDASGLEAGEKAPFAPASAIELVVLPKRENVQITIYNSADMTLVRERRELTLKRGWNWLQFMWANTLIDPTSLSLEAMENKDKIEIQQLVYPARLKDVGRWLIRSEVEGKTAFEITYLTSGLSWRAFYMGTLAADERTMSLRGFVRVTNNSGEDYEGAQTRLIVGQVHQLDVIEELARRQYPYGRPGVVRFDHSAPADSTILFTNGDFALGREVAGLRVFDGEDKKEIVKEGLSEYFLYTIEGTETIENGWSKRLESFAAEDVKVESLYKYDEERYGGRTVRYVKFVNDEEHNLGETPLPNGDVKIYRGTGEDGHLSYVGGTSVKYIPVDEEVELNLGEARLVSVEAVLMEFATENYIYDRRGDVAGWDEVRKWKVEVKNARTLPVEVEVTRGFGTACWKLDMEGEDVEYRKHDVTHARFETRVAPRDKRVFNYTVRTYHGQREEDAKS